MRRETTQPTQMTTPIPSYLSTGARIYDGVRWIPIANMLWVWRFLF